MISSSSNPEIKKIKLLISKSRERKRQKLFVVEGKREITRAYQSGYDIVSIFYRENFNENIEKMRLLSSDIKSFDKELKDLEESINNILLQIYSI